MKVLLVSTNTLPASPSGPAYIAGAALRAGHTVEVFECLFARDLAGELKTHLARFQPDVIGLSIRLVHGYVIDEAAPFYTRHLDLRRRVKTVTDTIRQVSAAPIVLGGPGFNYYGPDWLEYLGLDYGLRGEADFSFPLYLHKLERGEDVTTVPGCIFRRAGRIGEAPRELIGNLDDTTRPAYELFDLHQYEALNISPAILTKRGCAIGCAYCPYRALEGARYRLKSPARVVDEIEPLQKVKPPRMVMFCDNNFNVPHRHAEAICREIIRRKGAVPWGTGSLWPRGLTLDFCRLLRDSGCNYVNLSVESGSDRMLQRMKRGYTAAHVRQAIESLAAAGIPFSASLLLGGPGETPETVAESLALLQAYPIPLGTWVTVGLCLWTSLQPDLAEARQSGQVRDDELFRGATYMSPALPEEFMRGVIETLHTLPEFTVQVNKPYAGYRPDSV